MEIREIRAIRGPNYYHQLPVIFMQLDLGELENKPSHLVPGFREHMHEMMPSMYNHTCSPGVKGGFYERLDRGTWAGHIVEHVAIELQVLIGHKISFGKTFTQKEKGIYNLVYRYKDENVGLRAGSMAVDIVEKLFRNELTEIEPLIQELKDISERSLFGPSTQAIVDEAMSRGIPHMRLNKHSYVQLGQGRFQRRIQATLMDNTSALGVDIAQDKDRTKKILQENGVLVPEGRVVRSWEEALRAVRSISYPVVVKPLAGNHGRGVSTNINNEEELRHGFDFAKTIDQEVVVEEYIRGFDYRLLVIDGKFVAAALREPAFVLGDGIRTVRALIEEVNRDPRRGDAHEKVLTKIAINNESLRVLELQGSSLEHVPADGEKLYVKSAANLSSGGTAKDVTDSIHSANIILAERVASVMGLNVMGIDLVAESLEVPIEKGKGAIVEVNAGPGLRMHLQPSEGQPRNVAKNIVDMLFPEGVEHSVPICAITGTNGKTTTTRLISHILSMNNHVVGMTSTGAVTVNNIPILKGDYSGPEGAKTVMKDATIDMAVLEVARGGILRRGLGFKRCDVGVFLNVSSDHLGAGGIETLEDLARVKSTVIESVKKNGYAVLNADDPLVMSRMSRTKGEVVLFSLDKNHPELRQNLAKGHMNVTVSEDKVIVQKPGGTFEVASVMEIPITFEGQALFNVSNVLAAVGATVALGMGEEQIRAGLLSFSPSIGQSPGRMNSIDIGDFKVLIDYGHNVGAIKATADFIQRLMPGRKIRMTAGVGNRRTEDIIGFGRVLAPYYDHVIICDPSPRGRAKGETANYVKQGLLEGGLTEEQITIDLLEKDATMRALTMAKPGDLIVLQVEDVQNVTDMVLDYKKKVLGELDD